MNRKDLSLNSKRPRLLGLSVLVALGLAVPVACGGGSGAKTSSQKNPDGGGTGGGTGATGGGGGATGGSSATGGSGTGGSATGGTGGTSPDASADSGACVKHNGGVEICDGLDDDCNGKVDDHVAVPNTSPQAYTGDPCQPCGTYQCPTFGGGGPKCVSNADAGTQVERCDGHDDNCDGIVDNVTGIGDPCGACKNGKQDGTLQCPGDSGTSSSADAGALGLVCVGATTSAETCDGLDDNCDGQIDNYSVAQTCTPNPTSPSGKYCDGNGNLLPVSNGQLTETCGGTAGWSCPATDAPVYYFLDADGDGYPEPIPGITPTAGQSAVIGPEVYSYNPGPYCDKASTFDPPVTPTPPGTPNWIKTTYDWRDPTQRANDPYFLTHTLSKTNSGFDCCDAEKDAYPGQQNYYQAGSGAPNAHSPIPSVCTNAPASGFLATQPWDFNCDGSYEHQAPANTGTNWQQCAQDCFKVGWDTFYPTNGHCWHDCGDTTGNWLYTLQCSSPGHHWSPQCH